MSNIKCNINENVSYNEIMMYYLHNDYEKRTLLIQELSIHIEHLYDIFLITTDDRKKAMTMLNELLNELNIYYNKSITEINPDIKNSLNSLNNVISNDNTDELNNSIIIDNLQIKNSSEWCKRSEIKASIKLLDILRKNNTVEHFAKY